MLISQLHTKDGHINKYYLPSDEVIEKMDDPFLYITCNHCKATEGQPFHQKIYNIGCFENLPHDLSPIDHFMKCLQCSPKKHDIKLEVENQEAS